MSSIYSEKDITTYSEDEKYREYKKRKRDEALEEEELRKKIFEEISATQSHEMFKIPGINIMKFTHKKIKFCFQPSLIYEWISKTYLFYCTLRYLDRYKKWIIKREPMPARPLFYKVTSKFIFIDDDLEELYSVILKVYKELIKWSKDEIYFRRDKYMRYCKGELTYIDIDSVDEELYFSDKEREALFQKRQKVLKRMLPPKQKPKSLREHKPIKYII